MRWKENMICINFIYIFSFALILQCASVVAYVQRLLHRYIPTQLSLQFIK
jgi:hypothetical protein